LRAGGAGVAAFYTPTGAGTVIEQGGFPIKLSEDGKSTVIPAPGREHKIFNGRRYIMEEAITGDFSIVKGWKADPNVATAGKLCIVEVEEIVPAGSIDPDHVHLPSCYVDRIVRGEKYVKQIEFRTITTDNGSG
jgi:acyl CoA:acetate/3-ketoacid CoA transferase alpha subunit